MHPLIRNVLLVAVATLGLAAPVRAQFALIDDARVIVKYKTASTLLKEGIAAEDKPAALAKAMSERTGIAFRAGASVADRTHVLLATGFTSEQIVARLAADSDVEYVVPDYKRHALAAPNDPLYVTGPALTDSTGGPPAGQWYLRAPSGDVVSSINVEPAWSVTQGSPAVVVAVLDTGVRFDHTDLRRVEAGGNLLPGYDMVSNVNVANDGTGRDADPSDPGDWVTQAEAQLRSGPFYQCDVEDSSWHGTQTSGLIGALTNDGIGMASVGRTIRVLPVRVLGKCGGFDSDIIAGMRWAAGLAVPGVPPNGNPARVLNLSLGSDNPCTAAYRDAVAAINGAGAVVVASAGNSTGHAVGTPAGCPGVIAVGGLRHAGTKVGFSDLGPEISISAPAGNCINTAAGTPCLYPILTTSNAGVTVPVADADGGSIYTDSFNASLGTSFSAPLVSGTVALMLSAQPALTPVAIEAILRNTARAFPPAAPPLPQCVAPQPAAALQIDQLECGCTTATCGAGMLDVGAAVFAARAGAPPNYTGLFWNSPAGSESGWGINFAHQGDVIFATWFTYDLTGKAWWLAMTANKTGAATFAGTLYQTSGPPFNVVPFFPSAVHATPVGSATLTFSNVDNGTFAYVVNGVAQTKAITRQVFGPVPACAWNALPVQGSAGNFQDLWWAAPAGVESGWGVNFTQQGNTIFATWFAYDVDGTPLWLSVTAQDTGLDVFSGTLYSTTGPPFNAVPFRPADVTASPVGSATIRFTDGDTGILSYTVGLPGGSSAQSKAITREVFRAPGTVCQ
jgi:serine protease